MSVIKVKHRATGAAASVGRQGKATVESVTGGRLEIATAPSEAGFNPLDLVYASLAACLVLSGRIAASRLGLIDRLDQVRAEVAGEKAGDEPSRIERVFVSFAIDGDLDEQEKHKIAALAEEICTVSNTLRAPPDITVTVQPS